MALFSKKEKKTDVNFTVLPEHLGIIMDGNGRWAKKRGLPRTAGHKAGANVFRTISQECADLGIKYVTFYAFSTENWKRPKEEVDALMALFRDYLLEAKEDMIKAGNNKIKFIGEREGIRRKPAPDTVEEALRQLGMTAATAVYIGDSEVDIATAANSGLPCISVLWGFRDREFLLSHGAQCFVATPHEIL